MNKRAEQKNEERARQKDAGLIRYEVWCRPQHKTRIRAYAAKLLKKEPA